MESVDYLTHEVLRLIGNVRGKRVLELGMAKEALSATLASRGATAILIEESQAKISELKLNQETSDPKFEIRHNELADLAFCPAESIDLAVSVISLSGTKDIARVFRQLQRVLKDQGLFVFGIIHPLALWPVNWNETYAKIPYGTKELINRSLLNGNFPFPLPEQVNIPSFSETFSLLKRAGYTIDQILELPTPNNTAESNTPNVLLFKAHK